MSIEVELFRSVDLGLRRVGPVDDGDSAGYEAVLAEVRQRIARDAGDGLEGSVHDL